MIRSNKIRETHVRSFRRLFAGTFGGFEYFYLCRQSLVYRHASPNVISNSSSYFHSDKLNTSMGVFVMTKTLFVITPPPPSPSLTRPPSLSFPASFHSVTVGNMSRRKQPKPQHIHPDDLSLHRHTGKLF